MAEQVVFNEPAEFVPENVGDDDTFQAMATFRFLPPGSLPNNVGLVLPCFAQPVLTPAFMRKSHNLAQAFGCELCTA